MTGEEVVRKARESEGAWQALKLYVEEVLKKKEEMERAIERAQ